MERSKGYAMMFLLGAFVAGGALGFTADRVMDAKHGRNMRGPHAYRQRMVEELKLTPQQQASVDSLIEQKSFDSCAPRAQSRAKLLQRDFQRLRTQALSKHRDL